MKRPNLLIRFGVALLIVLPLTLLLIAAIAGSSADGPLLKRFANVSLFLLLLGPALTVAFTLVHTGIERLVAPEHRAGSVALAIALGCVTVLPLVLEPHRIEGILFGAFGGGLYGILVNVRPRSRRGETRAPAEGGAADDSLRRPPPRPMG